MSVIQKIGQFSEDHPVAFAVATTTAAVIGTAAMVSKVHRMSEFSKAMSQANKMGYTRHVLSSYNPDTHTVMSLVDASMMTNEAIGKTFTDQLADKIITDVMVCMKK